MRSTPAFSDELPQYIPQSEILVTDEIVVTERNGVLKTVYELEKRPFSQLDTVTAVVNGIEMELGDGEVEPRDTTGDGEYDSIAFIDPNRTPDVGTEASVTYVTEPVVARYTQTIRSDIDQIDERTDRAASARYISQASGKQLDRIGAIYGPLGRRLDRTDAEYRQFLRSIIQAFNGRGTKPSIRFVAGAALRIDADDVVIDEDFENTTYTLVLEQWSDHAISTVYELLDLANPSGVDTANLRYEIDESSVQSVDEATSTEGIQNLLDTEVDVDSVLVNIGVQETQELSQSSVLVDIGGQETEDLSQSTDSTTQAIRLTNGIDRFDGSSWDDLEWDSGGSPDSLAAAVHLASTVTFDTPVHSVGTTDVSATTRSTSNVKEEYAVADDIAGELSDDTVDGSYITDTVDDDTTAAVPQNTAESVESVSTTANPVVWDEAGWETMYWN